MDGGHHADMDSNKYQNEAALSRLCNENNLILVSPKQPTTPTYNFHKTGKKSRINLVIHPAQQASQISHITVDARHPANLSCHDAPVVTLTTFLDKDSIQKPTHQHKLIRGIHSKKVNLLINRDLTFRPK